MGYDLKNAGAAFKPTTGFENELEKLPDGEYELAVTSEEWKDATGVFEVGMQVVGGPHDGFKFKHAWFLTSDEKVNRFGGDLQKIGFDCENWTVANNRPFHQEFDKVKKVIVGMKLKVKKDHSEPVKDGPKKGTVYHNIRFHGRGADGKPEKIDGKWLAENGTDAFS